MKYITKIEWILEHDDFLICSNEVSDKIALAVEKKGKSLTEKEWDRIINNNINKKLKNSKSVKGICACDTNIMCKHRKKYLKAVLNG